jgi:uncharacterized membrane protein YcaP (DUF421 family)
MDAVVRGCITYFFIWLIFRIIGTRALNESTTFDLVLLLIISETVQNALTDQDHSMTGGFILVVTIVGVDLLLSTLSYHFSSIDKVINGTPLVILDDGKPLKQRMDKARVQMSDIMESARELHGLERLEQIKYAVLERNGSISIIPRST